jgi:hypothetical protein
MHHFDLDASIPRSTPVRAQQQLFPMTAIGTHHYWFYGYIGDLQYCFEFAIDHDCPNLLSMGVLQGHLLIHIEQVPRTHALTTG